MSKRVENSSNSQKEFDAKLPLSLRKNLIFLPKYSSKRCKSNLSKISKRIIHPNLIRRVERIEYFLAKMEFVYYAYRIRYPKYNKMVTTGGTTATGTLDTFRDCLGEIVLSDEVKELNRMQAINILIGQDSYQTLYEIAKNKEALGHYVIDGTTKKTVAAYIIENFPEHCDHHLLNLAFNLSARNELQLAEKAIDKIESPKSLLTVCMFLKGNPQNFDLAFKAVGRIGQMIRDNLNALETPKNNDEEQKKKTQKEQQKQQKSMTLADINELNPDAESEWMEPHELSVLFSAHKALEAVVLVFGNDKITSFQVVDGNQEMELVQLAINKMVIKEFLKKLSRTINDTSKQSYCQKRLNELENGEIDVSDKENTLDTEIQCLLNANSIVEDQIDALRKINNDKDENGVPGLKRGKYKYLVATLSTRLEKKIKGEPCYPEISDRVGYEFCDLMDGHNFQPKDDNPYLQICTRCHKPANNDNFMGGYQGQFHNSVMEQGKKPE